MKKLTRKFATILATDCVGFSQHMLKNEELTFESLNACRAIIDGYIDVNGGAIFHTAGDSVLAEFTSPLDAVNAQPLQFRSMDQMSARPPSHLDAQNQQC